MYYHNKILLTYSNIDEVFSRLNLFFVNLFRFIILAAALPMVVYGSHFSASFRDADIKEFINTVSKNINKTIIIDPKVQGVVSVRSFEQLDKDKYYQFFLNVLDVYGYTVVEMPNNILKVIPAKRAKNSVVPLQKNAEETQGDELINRVFKLKYILAKNLAPLLRQLNDNTESGSIIHYDPSNVILITGRAAVVNRLYSIIGTLDQPGDAEIELYQLNHALAADIIKLVNQVINPVSTTKKDLFNTGKVIADERTNSVLISGDSHTIKRAIKMIKRLDQQQDNDGTTKVVYMKYAQASKLLDVLNGVSNGVQSDNTKKLVGKSNAGNVSIRAYDQTNALVITAHSKIMKELDQVIEKLDVRRAQVLVEAIIVETQNGEGLNLGIQWANKFHGGVNFLQNPDRIRANNNSENPIPTVISGLTAGFYKGNWDGLFTALATNSNNNILATPSIVTLDNMEAEFNVGQEVPVLTSTQTTATDKVYNSISRQSVGVMLKVKPQINKGDSVLLEIRQEVSSVADSSGTNANNLGSVFNKRVVNNAVLVKSGETVVVGGLLDKKLSKVINKVPFLGDIPLIGRLFQQRKENIEKSNLILFIRPTILRETNDYSKVTADKYAEHNNLYSIDIKEPIEILSDKINNDEFNSLKNDIVKFYEMIGVKYDPK
ncbi:type II secretion system secretin GspD [Yersinia kristensenii]|nr:type II secretion system secretin GspD [Yersinia kristensenii]MBW5812411.1 type II secretion system secretin GspD [Yersinia kristensenii]MBW5817676.1 type II secretion system secretin GspD [Yersinia kristensenii]MBW5829712.1 type II secretion system secretin GspD [Yersinia kristensenii]MBW5843511.1 type II secretion system secretin GspD [Yersinia kristensenii]MDA5490997.1 type II secretion system secretin GspD [Yersinia kristensenii]